MLYLTQYSKYNYHNDTNYNWVWISLKFIIIIIKIDSADGSLVPYKRYIYIKKYKTKKQLQYSTYSQQTVSKTK